MRGYFIILLSVFLIACNEYTITNKTDKDVQLAKSGGDTLTIPAQSCVKLMEFLIGMGGDFPFSFKDCSSCKAEYTSGHYEIKGSTSTEADSTPSANEEQTSGETTITVTESDENSDCDKTNDEESKAEQEGSDENEEEQTGNNDETQPKPGCENDEFQLACLDERGQEVSDRTQCRLGENDSFTIVCVGNKGIAVSGLTPACIKEGEENQDPVCQESGDDDS